MSIDLVWSTIHVLHHLINYYSGEKIGYSADFGQKIHAPCVITIYMQQYMQQIPCISARSSRQMVSVTLFSIV